MATQTNPFGGSAALSGPSPRSFYVTQAMCEGAISDGLPDGSPLPAAPKLPYVLRAIRAKSAATVTLQSAGGGSYSLTLAAGDVISEGYVAAITGLASDTALIGYV